MRAGHHGRRIRSEVDDWSHHIGHSANPSQFDLIHDPRNSVGVIEGLLCQRRADEGGADCIYSDALLAPFNGHCLREPFDRKFSSAIDRVVAPANMRHFTGHVNNDIEGAIEGNGVFCSAISETSISRPTAWNPAARVSWTTASRRVAGRDRDRGTGPGQCRRAGQTDPGRAARDERALNVKAK